MSDKILLDENGAYKFDFSKCNYAWDIHNMATQTPILSDVDFITEIEEYVIFIEYKNANVKNAKNPDGMLKKIKTETFYQKIARKYYDSLLLFWACNKSFKKIPIIYVLIIEHSMIDKKIRKMLKEKIKMQLPFKLEDTKIINKLISQFDVCNLEEWKEKFPSITITSVE